MILIVRRHPSEFQQSIQVQVSVLTIDTSGVYWQGISMSRKLRIEYPGAMYHVMNRGDQREDIFRDDPDRQKFLKGKGVNP